MGSTGNQGEKRGPGRPRKTEDNRQITSGSTSYSENKVSADSGIREEITLIVTALVSVLMILSYFGICGPLGKVINTVSFGLFGVISFALPIFIFGVVAYAINGRGRNSVTKQVILAVLLMLLLASLIQLICGKDEPTDVLMHFTNSQFPESYIDKSGEEGFVQTYGGLFGGMIAVLFCTVAGKVAAFIIVIALMLIVLVFLTGKMFLSYLNGSYDEVRRPSRPRNTENEYEDDDTVRRERETRNGRIQRNAVPDIEEDPEEPEKRLRHRGFRALSEEDVDLGIEALLPEGEPESERIRILRRDGKKVIREPRHIEIPPVKREQGSFLDELKSRGRENEAEDPKPPVHTADTSQEISVAADNNANNNAAFAETDENGFIDSELRSKFTGEYCEPESIPEEKVIRISERKNSVGHFVDEDIEVKPTELKEDYKFPPVSLLASAKNKKHAVGEKELNDTAKKLQDTLESFGVGVTVSNVSCGPTVTRYELLPDHGVKVSKITALTDDIKLNLAAKDIRIEAPIPGKAAIGIEVPNSESVPVLLRDIIESEEYRQSRSDIAVGIGRDVYGNPVIANIEQMPHLLVAGATGSGKSVCINTIIISLLYKAKPSDVKLILIDPKIVELSNYNKIPHLMLPVITDPQKAAAALNWAVAEMDKRYAQFAEQGVRDLAQYNYRVEENKYNSDDEDGEPLEKMPRLVIIVDELADLMMTGNGKEVENMIVRLTQKARAAGIHLILATQRPTVNVITGLIKANVPARIAFSVSSALDSRTILDSMGAERLLGKGDMLFLMTGQPKAVRLQGAFVSDNEINAVCKFLEEQVAKNGKHEEIKKQQEDAASVITVPIAQEEETRNNSDHDELFEKVGRFIIEKEKASIGMLQRFFSIGYNRAARIMDQLCDAGVVGPEEIKKPRKILMTIEEFEEYLKNN